MPLTNVTIENINGGMLLAEMNRAIARLAEEVIRNYQEYDDKATAKGSVSLTISIEKDPRYDDHCAITPQIKLSLPQMPKCAPTLAEMVGHELKCQLTGTSAHVARQETMDLKEGQE